MIFVYCRGGDKTAPEVAKAAGIEYGVRGDYKPYAPPYMIDVKWRNYDWPRYLRLMEQYAPSVAMVPDYESPEQLPKLLKQIADLESLVGRVMVCPKFDGALADIDTRHLVALSVPTEYAGFLPDRAELIGRDIHLLGGHPDQQAYLIRRRYAGLNIVSADGNVLGFKANKGMVWSELRGDWWQTWPSLGYSSVSLAIVSAKTILPYLTSAAPVIHMNDRVRKCAAGRTLELEWTA